MNKNAWLIGLAGAVNELTEEVEGLSAAEIAPLLGIAANSVAALAYRAREGLRQEFLRVQLP